MKTTKTLRDLMDEFGGNGVIRIDDGNGSAGPMWIEWTDEMDTLLGGTKMYTANTSDKAYEQSGDGYDSDDTLADVAKYVVNDYSCDEGTMYASDWIEDDDRNAPYQATNPYRYRLVF